MRKSHQRSRLPLRRTLPAAIGMILASGGLQAGTIAITTTADSGAGSFRAAIISANGNAGTSLIDFSQISGATITLASDLPMITEGLILQGSEVTIDGNEQYACLATYGADLTVEDMTISRCTGSNYMQNGIPVAGTRVGGGIHVKYGNLAVSGSTISNNSVGDKYGTGSTSTGLGGGILAIGESLTVSDSDISGNSAYTGGGIVHLSLIETPASAPQGALPGGQTLITNSQISENSATAIVGGLMAVGTALSIGVDRSEITDNQAGEKYGGIALNPTQGATVLSNSTISGNSALGVGFGGGAIGAKYPGTLELLNNTVIDNSAPAIGGLALSHQGGNIQISSGDGPSGVVEPITLVGQTITGNTATDGPGGGLTVYFETPNVASIDNSIIAGNSAAVGSGDLSSSTPAPQNAELPAWLADRLPEGFRSGRSNSLPDGALAYTTFAVGHSLIGEAPDDDSAFFPDGVTSSLLGQDPELGPLADNGGPTRTLMPAASSPALNIISAAVGCGSSFNIDQRGAPRPEVGGSLCDAGSVERAVPPLIDVNPDIAFGSIDVGTPAVPQAVTLANLGGEDLEVSAFNGLSTPFTLDFSDCGAGLPLTVVAGNSCALQVGFAPTAAGDFVQTVTVASNSPTGDNSFELSGSGLTPGIAAAALDFGTVPVSQSASDIVAIENTGLGTLDISNLALSGDPAGVFALGNDDCGAPIPAGNSCTVTIEFTPNADSAFSGQLAVTSNATSEPLEVALSGTGIVGNLVVSPLDLDFGDVEPGDTGQSSLTLSNDGEAPLTINGWTDPGAPFSISGGSCPNPPFALAAGESCTLNIGFAPDGDGDFAASVVFSILGDASGSTTVGLIGGGTLPPPPPVRDAVSVPTLNTIGLIIGGGLLALMGLLGLRRRNHQT